MIQDAHDLEALETVPFAGCRLVEEPAGQRVDENPVDHVANAPPAVIQALFGERHQGFADCRRVGQFNAPKCTQGCLHLTQHVIDDLLMDRGAYVVEDHEVVAKAIEYLQEALSIHRALNIEEHPDVAKILNNLGTTYFYMGQTLQAKDYFNRAYDLYNQFFGPEHPYTKGIINWLIKCK